jgi:hypothetical protein
LCLLQAARSSDNKVLSFSELQELGRKKLAAPEPPKPSDLSTIMYTSGTTGARSRRVVLDSWGKCRQGRRQLHYMCVVAAVAEVQPASSSTAACMKMAAAACIMI